MMKINEMFYSIQGESTLAGLPMVFIRTAGCNLRCNWCDTKYAYDEYTKMSIPDILRAVYSLCWKEKYPFVEITGGEPLIQKDTLKLMKELVRRHFFVLLETNGTQPIDLIPYGVKIILDIKTPSSGMTEHTLWDNIKYRGSKKRPLFTSDEIKFVIKDRKDYEYALDVLAKYPLHARKLFSPVHGELEPRTLAQWILEDQIDARLQLQLHKIIWPDIKRGV